MPAATTVFDVGLMKLTDATLPAPGVKPLAAMPTVPPLDTPWGAAKNMAGLAKIVNV